ncbi:MAG: hypothetical protein HKN76_17615 [Saprospiraceae bacterium]|nr:hypothetical protein [Saprospiraceae bacterium]
MRVRSRISFSVALNGQRPTADGSMGCGGRVWASSIEKHFQDLSDPERVGSESWKGLKYTV